MDQNSQDENAEFNLNLLRGWQRTQLRMLQELADKIVVPQSRLANASGSTVGSHELGGKMTALTRSELMIKAGKDENGQTLWQLNEDKVKRETLGDFLKSLHLEI